MISPEDIFTAAEGTCARRALLQFFEHIELLFWHDGCFSVLRSRPRPGRRSTRGHTWMMGDLRVELLRSLEFTQPW